MPSRLSTIAPELAAWLEHQSCERLRAAAANAAHLAVERTRLTDLRLDAALTALRNGQFGRMAEQSGVQQLVDELDAARTKITKCLGVLGGRPAEQQPGQPPRRSGGNHRLAARHAGPPCLQEQAVPFAGPLRIVLHSLRDVLVDAHGRSPRQRLSLPLRSALDLTLTEHESNSEIHPQHCPIALPRLICARGSQRGSQEQQKGPFRIW